MSAPVPSPRPASLWRRLAAIVYDTFAVFGVSFAAGAAALAWRHGATPPSGLSWFTGYLLLANYAYFAYSWRRGQTLGMRAWKLRVVDCTHGGRVAWRQTAIRFAVALLAWVPAGFGYWRSLWDAEGRAWHDTASGTRLIDTRAPATAA